MKEYKIGDIVEENEYTEAAVWCKDNNATLTEIEPKIGEVVVRMFEIVAIPEHIPTKEEQKEARSIAYQQEVDPITCHINRLSDEEQTPEIEQEIAGLKAERSAKVEEIKERYPYPVEE